MAELELGGFTKLFGPGTHTDDIANFIKAEMEKRWASEGAGA
jgi:methylmalonyl-CoA mutase cobalamin-binding subunit